MRSSNPATSFALHASIRESRAVLFMSRYTTEAIVDYGILDRRSPSLST